MLAYHIPRGYTRERKEFIDKLQKSAIRILLEKGVYMLVGNNLPHPCQLQHTHSPGIGPCPSRREEDFRSVWGELYLKPRSLRSQELAPHSANGKEMWLARWSDSGENAMLGWDALSAFAAGEGCVSCPRTLYGPCENISAIHLF